jgi:putative transposase
MLFSNLDSQHRKRLASIERRSGEIDASSGAIQFLSDNGSVYTAGDTRKFAKSVGLEPRRTPVRSPQSNGMAESFVRTIKHDYVAIHGAPDAITVLRNLPKWFEHYNEVHPHKALGYRSPREFKRSKLSETT